ncbi:hypothetical protein HQ346_05335 [Rhodococcus sp. BP-252]|uniref:hypothetical protein n=1 Tax=unclassified Rhodococcus (in: high G+C Gram-positive bacteria) TaxID=192944 RepID=UPI00142FFF4B|nr:MULTISPECIES: hypothetical protein [unclassified Rhodococcus (in: high G+C Gram-positive bacteria)]MBY6410975.1 hypothetical protein [Rhodococcus sp. BP-320]MBY6415634.1 hypothetical protein [Rhodococcus sp. BP-321]MBY6420984.1 hypothetical protein [Rhodococcus sp. BP-324]MBY6426039.1 hypothetical protein [Rhodococcus sp. BP-323]MBY6430840.1 hypothetical protein [Rhodococcus sp. BP-322]
MKLWKILGLAGVAGVAATGAFVVRSERARRAYAPDEVRQELHKRFAEASTATADAPASPTGLQRLRSRFSRAR